MIARQLVSSVRDVPCSWLALFTSGVEQLGLVPGAYVAYVGKMRLERCCLWRKFCASEVEGLCAVVTCLMGVQFLSWLSVKIELVCTRFGYMAAVVTGNLSKHGGGLMCGGRVLFDFLITSVNMREGRTGVSRRLIHRGRVVRNMIISINVFGCFVDSFVQAGHPCLNV